MSGFLFYLSSTISGIYFIIGILYIRYFFTNKKYLHSIGRVLTLLNIVIHVFFMIYFGKIEGRVPITSVFEAMTFLALLLAGLYVFIELSTGVKSIGSFVFPLIFIFQLAATFGITVVELDESIFKSPLFGIHTITAMIGYSAFVFSMIIGIMYLTLFHEIKGKKLRFIYDRLPPLETMDKLNVRGFIVGFIFLTVGIISGVVWARRAWDDLSFFDPKIFLSWVLWLIYLVGIICRGVFRWSGRKLGFISIIGFAVMIFTFVFVNIIFPTIHEF